VAYKSADQETIPGSAPEHFLTYNETSLTIDSKPEPKLFNYDYIVNQTDTQESVFQNVAKPIVD
jgi:hypothetical protein